MARLQKELESAKNLSTADRQKLLGQLQELEKERMGIMFASRFLQGQGEELQHLLRGAIPTDVVLKALETARDSNRLRRQIGPDKLGGQAADGKDALGKSVDQTIEQAIRQLRQKQ